MIIPTYKTSTILLLIFFVFNLQAAFAQVERTSGKIVIEDNPGGVVETWNLSKEEDIHGSVYIDDFWNIGTIELYDGRIIKDIPLKYNLRDDRLHIKDNNEKLRILDFDKIKKFYWFNSEEKEMETFVNWLDYAYNNTSLTGFLQLLSQGSVDLYLYHNVYLQKGNYSLIHDAGRDYDEYRTEEEVYYGKNNTLYKLPKKKKRILEIFAPHQHEVKNYTKARGLNIKKIEDLAETVNFYNNSFIKTESMNAK